MIIHFVNGTRVKLQESKYQTFVYVANFSLPGYVVIEQKSKHEQTGDGYTRLTMASDKLLFIDYENAKVMGDETLFCEPEFTQDHFTKQKETLPHWYGDVKEDKANG